MYFKILWKKINENQCISLRTIINIQQSHPESILKKITWLILLLFALIYQRCTGISTKKPYGTAWESGKTKSSKLQPSKSCSTRGNSGVNSSVDAGTEVPKMLHRLTISDLYKNWAQAFLVCILGCLERIIFLVKLCECVPQKHTKTPKLIRTFSAWLPVGCLDTK